MDHLPRNPGTGVLENQLADHHCHRANMDRLGGGELQEPGVEQLMNKLRRLQQGEKALEEEIKELQYTRDMLQEELATLQAEGYQLEEIHKEKGEMCRKLLFQCEESEQDSARQLKQNKVREELLQQYRCKIQELQLKRRQQRVRFENQLKQLMDQHEKLYCLFAPERVPAELQSIEMTKSQLLAAELKKLVQLHKMEEQLEEQKKEKQLEKVAEQPQEE